MLIELKVLVLFDGFMSKCIAGDYSCDI